MLTTQFFIAGMIIGALIAVCTFWFCISHITQFKVRRTFHIELESPKEYHRGILRVKEIINKKENLGDKAFGSYKK
tara:strand:+ start:181 stop:408 length:228 start_codon:yes stop_codon:yes gene_type:complete